MPYDRDRGFGIVGGVRNRSQLPRAGNGKEGKERFRYRIFESRVTEQ